ncbi:MAG: hypothetical protein MMC33_007370 [Icmadophila ericetorum]|nr:hypothetical protein [Icmadophila ericetorum]
MQRPLDSNSSAEGRSELLHSQISGATRAALLRTAPDFLPEEYLGAPLPNELPFSTTEHDIKMDYKDENIEEELRPTDETRSTPSQQNLSQSGHSQNDPPASKTPSLTIETPRIQSPSTQYLSPESIPSPATRPALPNSPKVLEAALNVQPTQQLNDQSQSQSQSQSPQSPSSSPETPPPLKPPAHLPSSTGFPAHLANNVIHTIPHPGRGGQFLPVFTPEIEVRLRVAGPLAHETMIESERSRQRERGKQAAVAAARGGGGGGGADTSGIASGRLKSRLNPLTLNLNLNLNLKALAQRTLGGLKGLVISSTTTTTTTAIPPWLLSGSGLGVGVPFNHTLRDLDLDLDFNS